MVRKGHTPALTVPKGLSIVSGALIHTGGAVSVSHAKTTNRSATLDIPAAARGATITKIAAEFGTSVDVMRLAVSRVESHERGPVMRRDDPFNMEALSPTRRLPAHARRALKARRMPGSSSSSVSLWSRFRRGPTWGASRRESCLGCSRNAWQRTAGERAAVLGLFRGARGQDLWSRRLSFPPSHNAAWEMLLNPVRRLRPRMRRNHSPVRARVRNPPACARPFVPRL